MKDTFTRQEVNSMLVSVFVFIGGSGKLEEIVGENYGEMAEHIIKVNESNYIERGRGRGVLGIVDQFKKG